MNFGFPLLTLATLGLNYLMNRENNEANEEIHEEDREFNRQERLETQSWNSPTQMISRGQAAGLNRMASLGLPASVASSAPSPIPMEAFQIDSNAFGEAAESGASVSQNESDARLKDEQAQNVALSNAYVNQKNELEVMKGIKELDNMEIDHDLKEAMRDNYMQQLVHNRKMSSLLQENQTFQNQFIQQQTDESIQRVAESKARVENEKIRVRLQSASVRSQLKLNDASVKYYEELTNNTSEQSATLRFERDLDTKQFDFQKLMEKKKVELSRLSTEAQVDFIAQQMRIAGFNFDKDRNKDAAFLNQLCQSLLGLESKEVASILPKLFISK